MTRILDTVLQQKRSILRQSRVLDMLPERSVLPFFFLIENQWEMLSSIGVSIEIVILFDLFAADLRGSIAYRASPQPSLHLLRKSGDFSNQIIFDIHEQSRVQLCLYGTSKCLGRILRKPYLWTGLSIDIINTAINMDSGDSFNPQSQAESKEEMYGAPKRQQKYVSGAKNGAWSDLQHAKYILYMEQHRGQMRSRESRRINKFYKGMATFIGTRNALQCRSHHQKLQSRLRYPNKIIAFFKKHQDQTYYNQLSHLIPSGSPDSVPGPTPDLKLQPHDMDPIHQVQPIPTNNDRTVLHSESNLLPLSPLTRVGQQVDQNMHVWGCLGGMGRWGMWSGAQYFPFIRPQAPYYQ